jgi:hypothetical protein
MEEVLQARSLPAVEGAAIGGFVLLCFLLRISIVWLYIDLEFQRSVTPVVPASMPMTAPRR